MQWRFPQASWVTYTLRYFPPFLRTKFESASTFVTSLICLIYPIPSCPLRLLPKVYTSKEWLILFCAMRTENSSPDFISRISISSRFLLILIGLNEQISGVFIWENYYSCESCMLELLPHPNRVPDSSKAKQ